MLLPRRPQPPLPPGPRTPPAVQLLEWVARPLQLMERCAREYGDAFTLTGLNESFMVFVSHPDMVRDVFAGDAKTFRAGEANQILKPVAGSRSVLLLDEA